ncbi:MULTISPECIES: hypothetical protein [unclassified Mesorhizobium]|uniref:hypothetical protein n=1 Tax=unclassified Mesorhizobium TaxID=325217 RepID=UPI0033358AB5
MGQNAGYFALIVAGLVTNATTLAKPLNPDRAIPSLGDINSPLASPLFKQVKAGPLEIKLEETTLADVEKAFGGAMHDEGDAGDSRHWLCYAGPDAGGSPSIFWFVSGEMGGSDYGVLSVALQPNPEGKVPEGCAGAPASLTAIELDTPGVGAPLSDVAAKFGAAKPDRYGHFGFAASYPASSPDQKDATVTQTLTYTAGNGRITGVAVTQVTTN